MANVPNLVQNSPYLSFSNGVISLANTGGRLRIPLPNPFYAGMSMFCPAVIDRPTLGQIWPRGFGLHVSGDLSVALGAQIYRSADLAITDATPTAIDFTDALIDDNNYWVIGDPSRIVIPNDGWYIIRGQIKVDPGAGSGDYTLSIKLNGTTIRALQESILINTLFLEVAAILKLVTTDYLELIVETNTGSTCTLKGGQNDTYIQIVKSGASI